jgi:hypothetical protein
MLRSLLLAGLSRLPVLTLAVEATVLGLGRIQAQEWTPARVANGSLAHLDGLAVAVISGDDDAVGTAEGALYGDRIPKLLGLMSIQPRLLLMRNTARFQATVRGISSPVRQRLAAVARHSHVTATTLIEANALVDAQCSAAVALPHGQEPLRVARNMDFFPASTLGPQTVVQVTRLTGQRPYVSIGWPGSAAIISGMNDAGLVACILLNHAGPDLPGGEPVGLRLAAILGQDSDLEAAVRRFAATPVGSSHYVLLADATTAAVVWLEPDGLHRHDPQDGWLSASNGPRIAGKPADDRGQCLTAHCRGPADAGRMRQLLTSSYMPAINAQAMLFEPATRTLELALGTGRHPAACQRWWRIELTPLFAGAEAGTAVVTRLPAPVPLPHYSE